MYILKKKGGGRKGPRILIRPTWGSFLKRCKNGKREKQKVKKKDYFVERRVLKEGIEERKRERCNATTYVR